MFCSLAVIAIVVGATAEAAVRISRDSRVEAYCQRHQDHFNKYCDSPAIDLIKSAKLAKFCPAYEKHCAIAFKNVATVEPELALVVPPPLPRGGKLSHLDIPLSGPITKNRVALKTRLTAAIIASCTPDCTAVHCTVECKCAHTHPKVHARCNPPSSAQFANVCQKWYAKCPMFLPVAYY